MHAAGRCIGLQKKAAYTQPVTAVIGDFASLVQLHAGASKANHLQPAFSRSAAAGICCGTAARLVRACIIEVRRQRSLLGSCCSALRRYSRIPALTLEIPVQQRTDPKPVSAGYRQPSLRVAGARARPYRSNRKDASISPLASRVRMAIASRKQA